jgi:hypothetical protein
MEGALSPALEQSGSIAVPEPLWKFGSPERIGRVESPA